MSIKIYKGIRFCSVGKEAWETQHNACSGENPPQTLLQSNEREHWGVLHLLSFVGAGRRFAMGFCRARIFPWDIRSGKALLNIQKICHFSCKELRYFPLPSPPRREAVYTVCNTSKYLIQRKHFPHEATQPKKGSKPWHNFPPEIKVLIGKMWEHLSWVGKTLTSVMCNVRVKNASVSKIKTGLFSYPCFLNSYRSTQIFFFVCVYMYR